MNTRTPQPQPQINNNDKNDNDSAVLWTIIAFVLLAIMVYIVYAAYNTAQYSIPTERATMSAPATTSATTNNNAATTSAPSNTTTQ